MNIRQGLIVDFYSLITDYSYSYVMVPWEIIILKDKLCALVIKRISMYFSI